MYIEPVLTPNKLSIYLSIYLITCIEHLLSLKLDLTLPKLLAVIGFLQGWWHQV